MCRAGGKDGLGVPKMVVKGFRRVHFGGPKMSVEGLRLV